MMYRRSRPMAAAALVMLCASVPTRADVVTINFESLPGPDGRLGTSDDVPLIGAGPGDLNPPLLSTQFDPVGVRFLPTPPAYPHNMVYNYPLQGGNHVQSIVFPIEAQFLTPVLWMQVRVNADSHGNQDSGVYVLRADGTVITHLHATSHAQLMTIAPGEPIYGFRQINIESPDEGDIDDLSFEPVPAPAAALLFGLALQVGARRRR